MQAYTNSRIAVLGFESKVGRPFLKQLLTNIDSLQMVYALQLEEPKKEILMNDGYLSPLVSHPKLAFIGLRQFASKVGEVDILFNLLDIVNPMHFQKAIVSHFFTTNIVCESLKEVRIRKVIQLSSIYCQNPGYVSENVDVEPRYIPKLTNLKDMLSYIDETFETRREGWQWVIRYMEYQYSKCSQDEVDVIRVSTLGPTLNNYEGYTPKFNSLTYLLYQIGNGFITNLDASAETVLDIVPADFVANYALILGPRGHQTPVGENRDDSGLPTKQKISVHNFSASSRNPVNVGTFMGYICESWQEYENSNTKITLNTPWKRKMNKLQVQYPLEVKHRLGVLMDIKSWKIDSQKEKILQEQRLALIQKYQYFLEHEWICESNKTIDTFNSLSPNDQNTYNFNVNSINWKVYAKLCCYAIKKHLLNHHVEQFKSNSLDLLRMQKSTYFSDIFWALTEGKKVNAHSLGEMKNYILSTKSVKEALRTLVEERMMKLQNSPVAYEKAQEDSYKIADEMCEQMFSQYSMNSLRVFAWFLHKTFRTIYEKVVIDQNSILKLKNHDETANGPIVIIPTHRSYIDFLIMSYVLFGYGIKCPHVAAAEDFLNMAIIHILLRKSGAFFIKRNQQKYKQLYKAIMSEYISKLLAHNHYVEFFIEGTRSRVGKMLAPKFGLLSIVTRNVLDGSIPDAQILPVTINYEKILEGESFTYEMMGETKVKESLSRLIKAANVLKENYGRIYIQICEPISVKKFFDSSKEPTYEGKLSSLGHHIVHTLSDNLVVTAPAIIATVILMHRKGISDDSLSEHVNWLCREIASRGIKIARSQANSSVSISNTLALMGDTITKSKKNMFQVQVSFDQHSFVKLFTMTYYRNTLTHIFFEEAIIAVCLMRFGHQKITVEGVAVEALFNQVKFLYNVVQKEFLLRHVLSTEGRFQEVLDFMLKKGMLLRKDGLIFVLNPNSNEMTFYGSLLWPVVQCYWITCLYLFKLNKTSTSMPLNNFLTQIQWFAQSLISERIVSHIDAVSFDTIRNAVSIFTKMGILKTTTVQVDGQNNAGIKVEVPPEELKKFEYKLGLFLKSSYAKSIKGILESGHGSVNLDFPFLAKL